MALEPRPAAPSSASVFTSAGFVRAVCYHDLVQRLRVVEGYRPSLRLAVARGARAASE